jgi:hypothetical protein
MSSIHRQTKVGRYFALVIIKEFPRYTKNAVRS